MLFHKINQISLQHRFRYEFRFLNEKGNRRTRYRLQLSIPLFAKANADSRWFATLGNEIMINTKKEFNISQNRAYAMLGYQIIRSLNL